MPKKINILFSAIGDVLPKNWKEKPDCLSELTESALNAWKNREPLEKTVRFLHKMPKQNGLHFRFFTVTEQENGSLLVSRGGNNG
ncbi:hemophilus-specific protein [Ursidibacter maritimus]|uniref:Hemophilus-specific protein n=1 Tax=Ursidibacter maritimus TaxID=1331689 RepID=A0A949T1L5_9PAST|nr:hemophilus-specific protein [Ursidibacter maritimus]MBV6524771.1 hemophilus-specific protein [Ursidibacter maritimus]MBV6526483.1 hemophilus-specific protein [Ursidibacter maritimus]MBV6527113.1 hemophilus-specific protein [Ursidibacter maritimus]MBV6529052.1 hemophilus-specific protein [Ursidibacter maritimus]MBV6531045.1 hemophilus-specific protein [Ursidibacter maritimus]